MADGTDVDALLARLVDEFGVLTDPATPAGARRGALDWFRSAWPTLRDVQREWLDDGQASDIVELARLAGAFLVQSADWAELVETSRAALDCARRLGDDDARLDLLQRIGVGLQQLRRDGEADAVFEDAVELAVARGDHRARGAALAHRGQLRGRAGEPDQAAAFLQQAALAYRLAGHVPGEARTLGDLAPLLHQLGSNDEAARYSGRARQLFHQIGDRAGEGAALRLIAADRAERGATAEALRALDAAIALFDAVGDDRAAVEALHATAVVHQRDGDAESARRVAERALERARRTGDPRMDELAEFREVVAAQAAVAAILAADSDTARAAIVDERPELLGGLALMVLLRHRDGADGVLADRADAALRLVAGRGVLADMVRTELDELRLLAGDAADRLPSALPDLVATLAITDDPDRRAPVLADVLDVLPEGEFPAVRGSFLLELARCVDGAAGAGTAAHDRAIAHAVEAARLLDRPQARRHWAAAQVFLGTAYRERESGDPAADVASALAAFRSALTVYRRGTDPEDWAAVMVNLANAYWRRRDGVADLHRAIRRHTAALAVFTRDGHPARWAAVQSNIGLVLTDPVLASDPANLEAGRRHLLQALESTGLAPLDRASALLNLSRCERDRLAGDPDDNRDAAVRYAREAFDLCSRHGGPLDVAQAASAVGDALGNAALRSGDDLRPALGWFERALALATEQEAPLLRAGYADNLANALAQLDDARPAELRRAIELHETAMGLFERHGDRMELARACYNLAGTLRRGPNPDPARAIALLERSLTVRTRDLVPLEWAESTTELARTWLAIGDPGRSVELLRDAVDGLATAPDHARRAWGLLGAAYGDLRRWSEATSAYENALTAAERSYRSSVLPSGKDAELLQVADLPREAAYAAAAAGAVERAAAILESGRARALGHRLRRDRADLAALDVASPPAAASYREAVDRVRTVEAQQRQSPPPADPRTLRASMTDAQAQLDAAVAEIQRVPGLDGFLRDDPAGAIAQACRSGPPLAYLLVTRYGAVALLATEGAVEAVAGTLTEDQLATALAALPSWHDDVGLAGLLDLLGRGLAEPLARRLRQLGASAVVLVATGVLGNLPVHAARYGSVGTRLLDDVDVSYAPSARVLLAAREPVPDRARCLLGIAEPRPSDPPLPWARPELDAVSRMFDGAVEVLPAADATTAAVLGALPRATHLHLACHGSYDPARPLDSHLALARGDRLTLRELLDSRALDGVRLVVASACTTAVTDMARLPDEAIGLPAGMVQAGAAAVIGTLWEVNDRFTALLVARFYALHLHGDPDGDRVPLPQAAALARAQSWMAGATIAEVDRFAAEVGLRRRDRPARLRSTRPGPPRPAVPAGMPFAERPSQWAAFVLVGDAR